MARYVLRPDGRVNLRDADGESYSLPEAEAVELFQQGMAEPLNAEEAERERVKQEAGEHPIAAGAYSALDTLLLGAPSAVAAEAGDEGTRQYLQALKTENPLASAIGGVAGVAAPVGPIGMAGAAVRGAKAATTAGKLARGAGALAAEGGLAGAGGVVSERSLAGQEITAGELAAGAGLGALTAVGVGGLATGLGKVIGAGAKRLSSASRVGDVAAKEAPTHTSRLIEQLHLYSGDAAETAGSIAGKAVKGATSEVDKAVIRSTLSDIGSAIRSSVNPISGVMGYLARPLLGGVIGSVASMAGTAGVKILAPVISGLSAPMARGAASYFTPDAVKAHRDEIRSALDSGEGSSPTEVQLLKELDAKGPDALAAGLALVADPALALAKLAQGPGGDFLLSAPVIQRLYPEAAYDIASAARELIPEAKDATHARWLKSLAEMDTPKSSAVPKVTAPTTAQGSVREIARVLGLAGAMRALFELPQADPQIAKLNRELGRIEGKPGQEDRVEQVKALKAARQQALVAQDSDRLKGSPVSMMATPKGRSIGEAMMRDIAPQVVLDSFSGDRAKKVKGSSPRVAAMGTRQVQTLLSALVPSRGQGKASGSSAVPAGGRELREAKESIAALADVDIATSTAAALQEQGMDPDAAMAIAQARQAQLSMLLDTVSREPSPLGFRNYVQALQDPRSILTRIHSQNPTFEDIEVMRTLYPEAAASIGLVARDILDNDSMVLEQREKHFLHKLGGFSPEETDVAMAVAQSGAPQQPEQQQVAPKPPMGSRPPLIADSALSPAQKIGKHL